jgi:hypothetical protein
MLDYFMTETVPTRDPGGSGLGAVRDAWLFTRGRESVRIIRASATSRMFLHVYGPDSQINSQIFDDVICCMRYQADVERQLVGRGFSLERFVSERRTGFDRRVAMRGLDRRRLYLADIQTV